MAGRKQRRRAARGVVGALIAALLLVAAAPARADVWDQIDRNTSVAFDLVVLRPLNAAALVLGGVFFCASAPFVWPSEGLSTAYDVFIYAPYEYTVVRPLGEF